jgi:hypothetical protein
VDHGGPLICGRIVPSPSARWPSRTGRPFLRSGLKPKVTWPAGVCACTPGTGRRVNQPELKLGRHAALDRGARHLTVALGSMAVADAQQRTRHGHRRRENHRLG